MKINKLYAYSLLVALAGTGALMLLFYLGYLVLMRSNSPLSNLLAGGL